jgi:hypothetical protein
MLRLQMSMQESKQVGQSGSENTAKFVVGNQTKCPSWYLYRTVRHRPPSPAPGSQKRAAGYQSRPKVLMEVASGELRARPTSSRRGQESRSLPRHQEPSGHVSLNNFPSLEYPGEWGNLIGIAAGDFNNSGTVEPGQRWYR